METSTDDEASPAEPETGAETDPDDVDIVLPWWQHPVNILTLLVATALVAGMIGWLVSDSANDPDGGEVDIGFLQDMRAHHDQAVTMGYIYLDRPDTSPGLRAVARGVVLGQGIEIGRMIELLRGMDAPEIPETDDAMGWMGMTPVPYLQMPGMATDAQLKELSTAEGKAADKLFIELMTAHHQGALHMAQFAADEAESAEVRKLASTIYSSQREEIAELEGLLE